MQFRPFTFAALAAIVICCRAPAEDQPVVPEAAHDWTPKDYPEATLHARIAFLQPDRAWEQMDVWLPKAPTKNTLPCAGEQYREFDRQRFNPPRYIAWMKMDSKTGVLRGVPRTAGVFPVMISCMNGTSGKNKLPQNGDAILIAVHVKEQS